MSHIVFVADVFAEEYPGGAELTTEALIEASPFEYIKVKSKDVTMETLQQYSKAFWVFGNFTQMNPKLIPSLVTNIRYAVCEYDYKFCQYRSTHKHFAETGTECDCHDQTVGKLISAFFHGANEIFWMSKDQRDEYVSRFPFLSEKGIILSSVFSKKSLKTLKFLKGNTNRKGWLVQDSKSWIKGTKDTVDWCKSQGLEYETFSGLLHSNLLMKFYKAEGFAFLPKGYDTCPRVVIEAKVLGCDLHLNENVQHSNEDWFNQPVDDIISYLENRTEVFWSAIKRSMDITSTVGGYTTTYNCLSQRYPFVDSIASMLELCDEVVVVDAGSTDGTIEVLNDMANDHANLRIYVENVDFDHPRWAIHSDGDLKTKARSYITSDWAWQMDSDEIVHYDIREKLQNLLKTIPKAYDIVALPVVEYWGSTGKVRMDVNPWKWRVSRNKPQIIHGIPKELRVIDDDGYLYALKGTDSCDYIDKDSYERIPHATFYDENAHKIRIEGLKGSEPHVAAYQDWLNQIVDMLPTVYHYSWYDIDRKITSYKTHWGQFWKSMYDLDQEDTAENNVCFDKPWADVTEDDITVLAQRLEEEKGGHIFHTKINWGTEVPSIEIKRQGPICPS